MNQAHNWMTTLYFGKVANLQYSERESSVSQRKITLYSSVHIDSY